MSKRKIYKTGLYAIVAVVLVLLMVMNVTRSLEHIDMLVSVCAGVLVIWILSFAVLAYRSKAGTGGKTTKAHDGGQDVHNAE
ncbi:MAG: hypothetical protein KAZ98_00385 [Prevotella sp.]|nr:hypothetical protein [Prevotella sp.]